jgi:hypothetical protein
VIRPRVPSVILAAGLLVLLGLGLFVGGVLTGTTALYWGCVAACVVAAALLVVARRRIFAEAPGGEATAPEAVKGGTRTGAAQAGAAGGDETGGTRSEARGGGPADAMAGEAGAASGGAVAAAGPGVVPDDLPDPPVEDVEVTDLLLVVDLKDEVLVVDEHPRYHLAGCAHLTGRTTIPLPVDEARSDGFTPCAVCEPDRNLADRARARKHARDA